MSSSGNKNDKVNENEEDEEERSSGAESGRGAGKARKKGERGRCAAVFDGPEVPPPCEVCGKMFPSWKSLFGHMRSHPERSWRGVKPPPVFTPPASPEHGALAAATLLSIGEAAASPLPHFDLNDPMDEEEEEEDDDETPPPPSPKRQRTFDLNMPPPLDDEEEEEDGEAHN